MKMLLLALACMLSLVSMSASALCTLAWDYDDPEHAEWIDGFRFHQNGALVGAAGPADRTGLCDDLGLVPGPGQVTATAFRGTDESPHSLPAVFELSAPGLRIILSTP